MPYRYLHLDELQNDCFIFRTGSHEVKLHWKIRRFLIQCSQARTIDEQIVKEGPHIKARPLKVGDVLGQLAAGHGCNSKVEKCMMHRGQVLYLLDAKLDMLVLL
jgi:hypothetical protein